MRRDAADNRDRLLRAAEDVFAAHGPAATLEDVARAAEVGPATLYRRFTNKDALVREVLTGFFQRLIDVTADAERASAADGLAVFLRTVGVEIAAKAGLSAPMWGDLAPQPLVDELRNRSTALMERAKAAGAVHDDVTADDVASAVWALRGVIQSEAVDPARRGRALWQRHLAIVLRGLAP